MSNEEKNDLIKMLKEYNKKILYGLLLLFLLFGAISPFTTERIPTEKNTFDTIQGLLVSFGVGMLGWLIGNFRIIVRLNNPELKENVE